jgi:signal transduction histidine kinase
MKQPVPASRRRGTARLDIVLSITTIGLTFASALFVGEPWLGLAFVSAPLDLVINTVATLAAGVVSALAWVRHREGGQITGLYQASAFLVLCVTNSTAVVVSALGVEDALGASLAQAGQGMLYVVTIGRLLAAILLLVGAVAAERGWPPAVQPSRILLLAPTALLGFVVAALLLLQPPLPPLIGPEGLAQLRRDPAVPLVLPGVEPTLVVTHGVIGVGYLIAGYRYYRLHRRHPQTSTSFLAVGLVIAAFSQIHFAIYPGAYPSLVSTDDALRLAFYVVLMVGMNAEARADARAIRRANANMRRLREAELTAAAVEERARLAREVHDGLAQDLWFAKLKQGRLLQQPELGEEARKLVDEIGNAIDSGLAEARQAVMAMRVGPEGASTLSEVVERYVDDFGDRFGLRARYEQENELPALPPKIQAELLRIVQEALNNVRKHADATLVRVRAEALDGAVRFTVADNGRGFDPAAVNLMSVGLHSMRERAALLHGTIEIDSRPQDGTRVSVTVPVDDARRSG